MNELKKKRRPRPWGLWAIIACGVSVVAFLMIRSVVPSNDSPVAQQGDKKLSQLEIQSPDFVSMLNEQLRKDVDPKTNAEAALRKVLGPGGIPANIRDRYYQLLGLPLPNFADGDYFQSFNEFTKSLRQSVRSAVPDLDSATSEPWDESQYPAIAEWLAKNEKHLNDASAATELSHMYVPLVYDENVKQGPKFLSVLLPACQQHRELAKALTCRAMLRIGQGKTNEAWDDLQACHRLARHISRGASLVEVIAGMSVESQTCKADRALAAQGNLTAETARAMEEDLRNLEPLPSLAKCLDKGERMMFLDTVLSAAREGLGVVEKVRGQESREVEGIERIKQILSSAIDWDEVSTIGNHFYDKFVDAASGKTPAERRAKERALESEIQRMTRPIGNLLIANKKQQTQIVASQLLSYLLPAATLQLRAVDASVAEMDLTRLDLLLRAYHAEHGDYPDQLQSLVPKYLSKVPTDPLCGKPYVYLRTENRARLYSIGPNERDDGGVTKEERYGADDVVVELTPSM